MIDHALALPQGGYIVPDNRWDLVPAGERACPDISVVIPYYRNRDQLNLVLEGLKLQDYPRFEVIVADDGSPEPLSMDDPDLPVRVLRQEDEGFRAAAARNLAARAADGDLLCFLDQDTIPEPGYLSALSRLPSVMPDALAVGRREHADLTGWSPGAVRDWLNGRGPSPERLPAPEWLEQAYRESQNLLRIGDTSYEYLISAVMCCSKALFGELGGFDESFRQYGGEDWEFAYRAWIAGAVLLHEPTAVAWHDGPDWAGRATAEERYAMKAVEERALRERIPSRSRTGSGPDTLREQRRAARWQHAFPNRDLLDDLFGTGQRPAAR